MQSAVATSIDRNSHRTTTRSASELLQDETEMLEAYRRAKRMGYADLSITIQEGTRVKLWLTEKMR